MLILYVHNRKLLAEFYVHIQFWVFYLRFISFLSHKKAKKFTLFLIFTVIIR